MAPAPMGQPMTAMSLPFHQITLFDWSDHHHHQRQRRRYCYMTMARRHNNAGPGNPIDPLPARVGPTVAQVRPEVPAGLRMCANAAPPFAPHPARHRLIHFHRQVRVSGNKLKTRAKPPDLCDTMLMSLQCVTLPLARDRSAFAIA